MERLAGYQDTKEPFLALLCLLAGAAAERSLGTRTRRSLFSVSQLLSNTSFANSRCTRAVALIDIL